MDIQIPPWLSTLAKPISIQGIPPTTEQMGVIQSMSRPTLLEMALDELKAKCSVSRT
jgi:hypothetical protein